MQLFKLLKNNNKNWIDLMNQTQYATLTSYIKPNDHLITGHADLIIKVPICFRALDVIKIFGYFH